MAFTKVAVIFFFLMAMGLCHYSSIAEDSFENKNLITNSDNTLEDACNNENPHIEQVVQDPKTSMANDQNSSGWEDDEIEVNTKSTDPSTSNGASHLQDQFFSTSNGNAVGPEMIIILALVTVFGGLYFFAPYVLLVAVIFGFGFIVFVSMNSR
ncbi:unnamed protein product [Prunus armeniaca]|uniref:Transmembrane protein n=1 Tax=Prunus armeniaca TaxID=36596 RepID=A0A6J5WII0_PRUAR|nr:unnamed protein product [Prunus armeniaca]